MLNVCGDLESQPIMQTLLLRTESILPYTGATKLDNQTLIDANGKITVEATWSKIFADQSSFFMDFLRRRRRRIQNSSTANRRHVAALHGGALSSGELIHCRLAACC